MGRPTSNWQLSRGLRAVSCWGLWWAMVCLHLTGVLREPSSQGIRSHLPFSSKANTEVCPTDTCFNLCLGGGGMWYQQSPAVGRWAEMGPGSTTPVTQVPPAHLAFSAARGVKWVQPTSVPRPRRPHW